MGDTMNVLPFTRINHHEISEDARSSMTMLSVAVILLTVGIVCLMCLGTYHLGKYHQREEVRAEIAQGSATTLQLKSLGVSIHAPSGRIMSVSR
jgi:hypothetical protein